MTKLRNFLEEYRDAVAAVKAAAREVRDARKAFSTYGDANSHNDFAAATAAHNNADAARRAILVAWAGAHIEARKAN